MDALIVNRLDRAARKLATGYGLSEIPPDRAAMLYLVSWAIDQPDLVQLAAIDRFGLETKLGLLQPLTLAQATAATLEPEEASELAQRLETQNDRRAALSDLVETIEQALDEPPMRE